MSRMTWLELFTTMADAIFERHCKASIPTPPIPAMDTAVETIGRYIAPACAGCTARDCLDCRMGFTLQLPSQHIASGQVLEIGGDYLLVIRCIRSRHSRNPVFNFLSVTTLTTSSMEVKFGRKMSMLNAAQAQIVLMTAKEYWVRAGMPCAQRHALGKMFLPKTV